MTFHHRGSWEICSEDTYQKAWYKYENIIIQFTSMAIAKINIIVIPNIFERNNFIFMRTREKFQYRLSAHTDEKVQKIANVESGFVDKT